MVSNKERLDKSRPGTTVSSSSTELPEGRLIIEIDGKPVFIDITSDAFARTLARHLAHEYGLPVGQQVDPVDLALSKKVLHSLEDLVELLSLSKRTLEKYVAEGVLVPYRVGRRLLFTAGAVKAFLNTVDCDRGGACYA